MRRILSHTTTRGETFFIQANHNIWYTFYFFTPTYTFLAKTVRMG